MGYHRDEATKKTCPFGFSHPTIDPFCSPEDCMFWSENPETQRGNCRFVDILEKLSWALKVWNDEHKPLDKPVRDVYFEFKCKGHDEAESSETLAPGETEEQE